MASSRFVQLGNQLAALRSHLLPEVFDPTGSYEHAGKISTLALAYRVLAHAELESFFEDRAIDVSRKAKQAWDSGHVCRSAICLFAFSGKTMEYPPDTLEPPGENKRKAWPALIDVSEKFSPVAAAYHHLVRSENHGIKEKNLLSLLLPIGLEPRQIDPSLLADLDSFGALRGIAAHTSSSTTATQAVDPEIELKRVQALLPGIEAIDAEIEAVLASIPD